jgi:phage repressor protein C with HTH and peptisase S24 domain
LKGEEMNNDDMDTIGRRIIFIREQLLDLTQEEFAERIGVSRGAVGNWERDKPVGRKSIERICHEFDLSIEWVLTGKGEAKASETPPQSAPNAVIASNISFEGHVKIPLYGHAVGGLDGEFMLNGNKLDDITAPPALTNVRGAYAVTVAGDSMEPRYEDGETLFIDPHKRVSRGDYVVAQVQLEENGPVYAYIKKFVKHNAKELVLSQFNPQKDLTFPHECVVSVDFVVMGGRIF